MLCAKFIAALCALFSAASAHICVPLKRLTHEFIDTRYAGEVEIRNETFLLVFDTSSSNVILPSPECVGGSCNCSTVKKYFLSSNKNGYPVTVTFFDFAAATGKPIIDQPLTIGNLTSPHQGMILADKLGMELCKLGASGVVGLGPLPDPKVPCLETVVKNFVDEGSIENVFSIHHARYPDDVEFGELILGGSDLAYVQGNFTSAALVEDSWKFHIDEVLIGDENVADKDTFGFIDTSKSMILGPEDQVNKTNEKIGCTPTQVNEGKNLCVVDCNATAALPDLVFVINGTNFNISSQYYIQRIGDVCYSGIFPSYKDDYMIGDIFLDHYYAEFNWKDQVMRFAIAVEVAQYPNGTSKWTPLSQSQS